MYVCMYVCMYLPKSTPNGKTQAVAISVSKIKARWRKAKDKSANKKHDRFGGDQTCRIRASI